jgi:CubicO group peptidase (beta-lactamase class C family)
MTLMQGSPPPREAQVTLANWRSAPFNRWAFHHVRELIATAPIRRGETPWALPRRPRRIERITFQDRDGKSHQLGRALAHTFTDGFIVLANGHIVAERYEHGMRADDPHILMSISKSLTAALAGVLAARGVLDPASLVTDHVPELRDTAYAGASVQQLLDMRVASDFVEDYDATSGIMIEYRAASGWNPAPPGGVPGDLRAFLRRVGPQGAHGGPFKYTSPNTDLLGWVIERAAGARLPDLMARELWAPMGAEFDAYITVDRLGAPRTAGGICVSLRDLARLGQMMLQHGVANDRQVLPAAWVDDTTTGGDAQAWRDGSFGYLLPGGRYRNKWYQVGDDLGSFLGIGIHGQFLFVAPGANVVIARFASHPVPLDAPSEILIIEAMGALARALAN